jgi:hypothetical protein
MYKVKIHNQNTSIRFERPDSMLRYIQSLNSKGIKFELEFERDGNEPKDVPAAPFREPDGMRCGDADK